MQLYDYVTRRRWEISVIKRGKDITTECFDADVELIVGYMVKFHGAKARELYVEGIAI